MAILKNGLWGGVTGKLGNTVCYVVKGKQVVRMIVKSTKPPTERQLASRADLALASGFLKPIKELIKIGYAPLARSRKTSEFSLAVGYIKKNALKVEAQDREIDYSKVRVSQGDLPGLSNLTVSVNEGLLKLSWTPEYFSNAHRRDQVMTLVYCPPTATRLTPFASYNLCGVHRGDGHMELALPEMMSSCPLELYVFVAEKNGKTVSNSEYLGRHQS